MHASRWEKGGATDAPVAADGADCVVRVRVRVRARVTVPTAWLGLGLGLGLG